MKNILFFLMLLFGGNLLAQSKSTKLIAATCESRGCTGSDYCGACKNCSGCKHCAKEGGTCGVCSAPVQKKSASSKKSKKKKAKNK